MEISTSPNRKNAWITGLILSGIVILGAGLRLFMIGNKTVWLDEAFSIWLGWRSIPELIRLIVDIDQHPPIYYIILHYWILLGNSGAAWVRGLSALIGILTLPVIFLTARRLADARVGLIAAFILAINPFHVSYGQETRAYTYLTLCVCLSMWMLARLLTDSRSASMSIGEQLEAFIKNWRQARKKEDTQQQETGVGYQRDFRESLEWVSAPTRRRWGPLQTIETDLTWLGYMMFTAALIYAHNTAIFYAIGVNAFVFGLLLYRRWRPGDANQLQPPSLKNWFWAQVGVFLFWSPWLLAFFYQAMGVAGEFWIPKPTLALVIDTFKSFLSENLPRNLWTQNIIWSLFITLMVLGVIYFRKRLTAFTFLAAIFLAPVLGELLVSVWRPIFYVRTLIWATLPIYILIAAGVSQLRYKPYILVALAMVATVNSFSLREFYFNVQKEEWNKAAKLVANNVKDDDIILFNAGWTELPFDYYFLSYNKPVEEFGIPETLFENGELEPIMTEADIPRLQKIIQNRPRVWLVYSHNWYTDPEALIPRTLLEELKLDEKYGFYGMEVHLYTSQ